MTKTYAQIAKQIASLQAEASKLRQKEVGEVVARIRQAIEHYGLTAADLGLGAKAPSVAKAAPAAASKPGRKTRKAAKAAIVPKFRNEAGLTWGGRGKRPQWLRDALIAGKSLADFAIK